MTWMAPWAWLGLGTLVLPVLVHLLARGRAPLRTLPTLRFLEAAPPVAVRRTRLRDPFLLLLRLLVLLLAVAALARPQMPAGSTGMSSALEPPLTRVILVDASPGMNRPGPDGISVLEEARRRAREEAATASGPVLEGASGPARPGATYLVEVEGMGDALAQAMTGAGAFLDGVPGRREVVVFSDFQVGTLPPARAPDSGAGNDDLSEGRVGFRLEIIPVDRTPLDWRVRHPASETRITVTATTEGFETRWVRSPLGSEPGPPEGPPSAPGFGGDAEAAPGGVAARGAVADPGADLADRLAELAGLPAVSARHPVEVHLLRRDAEVGASELRFPEPRLPEPRSWSDAPRWMGDVALAIARDPVLDAVAAAHPAPGPSGERPSDAYLPLVRNRAGDPVVVAAPAGPEGGLRLVLAADGTPESLLAGALMAAVRQAVPGGEPSEEWDPRVMADADLAAWRQSPVLRPPGAGGEGEGGGLARLLWLVVLLLLGVEWAARGRRWGRAGVPVTAEGRR